MYSSLSHRKEGDFCGVSFVLIAKAEQGVLLSCFIIQEREGGTPLNPGKRGRDPPRSERLRDAKRENLISTRGLRTACGTLYTNFAAQMQLPVRSTSPSSQAFTNITCAGSEGEISDSQELIRAVAGQNVTYDTHVASNSKEPSSNTTPRNRHYWSHHPARSSAWVVPRTCDLHRNCSPPMRAARA